MTNFYTAANIFKDGIEPYLKLPLQAKFASHNTAACLTHTSVCSRQIQNFKILLGFSGSRRPSLTSMQSSSSSIRSYSAKMWEREREQKERRQMSMRLAQLHDKMAAGREIPKHAPTPSPRSPNNSTDGLLPSVCEIREVRSFLSFVEPMYLAPI